MDKIRIFDLRNRVLAFDLRDVLRVLAPRSFAAKWTIKAPGAWSFEATGVGGERLEELAEILAQIDGSELAAIADATVQVILGDFVGALSDDSTRPWLIIRAIDSNFFEIETSDESALAAVKSAFKDVRIA